MAQEFFDKQNLTREIVEGIDYGAGIRLLENGKPLHQLKCRISRFDRDANVNYDHSVTTRPL